MSHLGLDHLRPNDTASKAGRAPSSPRPRVLLVEDEGDIRDLLRDAIDDDGLVVVTAANGREALAMLQAGLRPAAILLDLMMPFMNGWDFRHEQLKDPELRQIAVVVITAAGFSVDTVRTQLGNVDLFPKPLHYLDLVDRLGRICRNTSPTR